MSESTMAKLETIGGIDKYKVENAYDSLIRAKEIVRDSKLLAAVKVLAKTKVAAASDVAKQLDVKVENGLKKLFGGKNGR